MSAQILDKKAERFYLTSPRGHGYHLTIGLEVHAQIKSKTKLFSSAPAQPFAPPNSQVSFVDAGFPGMLPTLNKACVAQAVKTAWGLSGQLKKTSFFDRKSYFYPDLPQGYQITQFFKPIMENGHLHINLPNRTRKIHINRLHIEQDAGKSLHDLHADYSFIDLNRAGVGLMEIVTEPELYAPEEAVAYIKKLRQLLIYLKTSDGNMEAGNLRVDANVSVAPKESDRLGTRVEIKNLNSIRFMQQAILVEAERQINLLEEGHKVAQETRLYNTERRQTESMRSKEDAIEYRYFPDPDLPALVLDDAWLETIRADMPELPDAKRQRFQETLDLSAYDTDILLDNLDALYFFEEALVLRKTASPKLLCNWIMGDVLAAHRSANVEFGAHHFTPKRLVDLLEMVAQGKLSGKMAKIVFEEIWQCDQGPATVVAAKGLAQITSADTLRPLISKILTQESDKVMAYHKGKVKLFDFFVGQLMKETKGQADPKLLHQLLQEMLYALKE